MEPSAWAPERWRDERSLLVVGHPGHELRVHRWLELARPKVAVLTDGSGGSGVARVDATARVVAAAGASCSGLFGALTDRVAYEILLERRHDELLELAERLLAEAERCDATILVGDAAEGFNPVHDLCRAMIDAVAGRLTRRRGRALANFEFTLEASPESGAHRVDALRVELDGAALERKLAAARSYGELRPEVERALSAHGDRAFALEVLMPVDSTRDWSSRVPLPTAFEAWGERRVREGLYRRVLRFEEHFLPAVDVLARFAGR